ncbi:bifunctional phosphopantothenoylcysteine decarboxylase/phosphopantothenate--cysteine ligase CoaBC [Devosia sp. XJ19-1]|uniref:Coenzyme A biosynthesis bifunctional protein CoaBC n=1 Tax=Devosia ureilytica TaxID=2952754 RepID=A0A9Q4AML1_9HYPH|nr:bifunctional phosphopantothenoylcysteine decarboxylase/phosphopantothenate--cysteine ligase CoaBC [Devosia ureilytica]MCP8882723.1 bifunctional phosphopantothenoylcysteine decarboxylase/phosphopantothenate--cysteine ligase CoaBC [Devosia ureilytica]MCP8886909.1 bifunctional phosphopantothenoylcysteine decarboxylase/phosphopantothenate--cysteine ligase CoaBC [Devosia ureilytica]
MANVLIAISGSISAYKIADVVSELGKAGHQVQCLLTKSATEFVSPLVLETLSGRKARVEQFGPDVSGTEHIDFARWAEVMVFAPASANLLARLALGLADDLPTTVALASEAPMLIAPAMNTVMWEKPIVQQHLATLVERGARVIEPASGLLACGEVGMGKLAPVATIVAAIEAALRPDRVQDLKDERILITAGPTTTAIDAVRYITNHSTGRMGAAMAEEALRRGAVVDYVLGMDKGVVRPVAPRGAESRLHLVEVRTAEEMAAAALARLPGASGVVATAAVMDYAVAAPSASKLKRASDAIALDLVPSTDVLGSLRQAARDQWFLGFAAETDNVEEHGAGKLKAKGLDFLFANEVSKLGAEGQTGFAVGTNAGVLLSAKGARHPLALGSKAEIARQIWDLIA